MGTLPESREKVGKICDNFQVSNPVSPQSCYFMNMVILPQIHATSHIIHSRSFWGNHSCRHVDLGFWRDMKMEEAEKTLKELKPCFEILVPF